MSRRALAWIAAAAILAAGLLILIRSPDEGGEAAPIVAAPGAASPLVEPLPVPPRPAPDSPARPTVVPFVPAPVEELDSAKSDFTVTMRLIVTVLVDGAPLPTVLSRLGIDSQDVHVIASLDPPGVQLDESLAPFYTRQGIGQFSPHRNSWDEDKVVGPDHCLGELDIPIHFPVHVSVALGSAVLATQRLDVQQAELTLTVTPELVAERLGRLRLRVMSAATGDPIPGAKLELGAMKLFGSRTEVIADEHGQIARAAAAGPAWLSVTADGFESLPLGARIPRGKTCDLGDIALQPATTVSGVVRRSTGQPAVDSFLVLVPEESPIDAFQTIGASLFDHQNAKDDGSFALACGRRRYLLVAAAGDAAAAVPVDATEGEVSGLELTLEPLRLLSVRLPDDAFDGLRFRLWTKQGLPVTSWPGWAGDRDDDEMLAPLLPGDYVLVIESARGGKTTRTIHVDAEPVTVDLTDQGAEAK